MTSLFDARAAQARASADQIVQKIALQQRACLLQAIWTDVHDQAHSRSRTMLPPGLLPPLPLQAGPLDTYAAECAQCPDGIWRVARDRVGDHPAACLLEAPLLAVFLPGLCRLLLGQSLMLPSMPIWWLRDVAALAMVASRPARFWLRPAFDPHGPPIVLADLSTADRYALQRTVALGHHKYVILFNSGSYQRRWLHNEALNVPSQA